MSYTQGEVEISERAQEKLAAARGEHVGGDNCRVGARAGKGTPA